jgi:hypothetical protein
VAAQYRTSEKAGSWIRTNDFHVMSMVRCPLLYPGLYALNQHAQIKHDNQSDADSDCVTERSRFFGRLAFGLNFGVGLGGCTTIGAQAMNGAARPHAKQTLRSPICIST